MIHVMVPKEGQMILQVLSEFFQRQLESEAAL